MRIRAEEKKVFGPRGKTLKVTYHDEETGRTYGRIVDGFAWPSGASPGVVVTVAESLTADHSLPHSPYHLYIVDEVFSADLEELYRACLRHRDEFCVKRVYGNPHSSLISLWRALGREGARISISEPSGLESIDLNFVTQLIRKHTSLRKTLHFGESTLPQHLSTIPAEEIEGKSLEHLPAIAALGFTLAVLEKKKSSGQFVPQRPRKPRAIRR